MLGILYIVVPCYNEEAVFPESSKRLLNKLETLIEQKTISKDSRVMFVNDGSKDKTWDLITELHNENAHATGINLSGNRGHQNALLAGLLASVEHADMMISIDADLQDDIAAMDQMIEKYYSGIDVVYGIRNKRETDSFFKRFTAESFYRVMNILGANTVFNHADYRLMSKRSVLALAEMKEVNLFLRGLVPLLGYSTDAVFYERSARLAGESKYPLKKMLAFAIEGITSLSIKPIRFISGLGFLTSAFSFFYFIYIIIQFCMHNTVPGWASVVASVWLIGGLILLSIGIIGEYIGKIYMETKGRPRFIIQDNLEEDENYSK